MLPLASIFALVHLMLTSPLISILRSASPVISMTSSFLIVTMFLPAVRMIELSLSIISEASPASGDSTRHSPSAWIGGLALSL